METYTWTLVKMLKRKQKYIVRKKRRIENNCENLTSQGASGETNVLGV